MAKEDKANLYLVAIVGIVGAVGILVMLMNAGIGSSSDDYSGQAIAGSPSLSGSSLLGAGDTSTIGSTKGGGERIVEIAQQVTLNHVMQSIIAVGVLQMVADIV